MSRQALCGMAGYGPVGITLNRDPNNESDLYDYRIYRGIDPGFVPGPSNLIGQTADPEFFDGYAQWYMSHYKVSGVDRRGNESTFADLSGYDVAGGGPPEMPDAFFPAQNDPIPFNPHTVVSFGLREAAHVTLKVYGAAIAGRASFGIKSIPGTFS